MQETRECFLEDCLQEKLIALLDEGPLSLLVNPNGSL